MSDSTAMTINVEIIPRDEEAVPKGWKKLEDKCITEPDGLVKLNVVPALDPKGGKCWVDKDEVIEREMEVGRRGGLRAAMALLREHNLIPIEWRGKILFFPGTVIQEIHTGRRCIAYLCEDKGQWILDWSPLLHPFDAEDSVVRCSRD